MHYSNRNNSKDELEKKQFIGVRKIKFIGNMQ